MEQGPPSPDKKSNKQKKLAFQILHMNYFIQTLIWWMVQKYNIILIWHLYLFTLNVRFIRVNRYIIAIKFYRIGFVYFYFIFLHIPGIQIIPADLEKNINME